MKLIDEKIEKYCIEKSNDVSEICNSLQEFTNKNHPMSQMLAGPLENALLGLLIRSMGVKNVLEIGTFTGYSSLSMAENLPDDGKVITIDVDPETIKTAKSFWNQSSHQSKITSIQGPALNVIRDIDVPIDLVFIDADKANYTNYLKLVLEKFDSFKLIVVDNCLWSGKVLDNNENDESTLAIKHLNDFVSKSIDLYGVLLPVRDGIFLITKK